MTKEFIQEGPSLKNQYEADTLLKDYLKSIFPKSEHDLLSKDLSRFGQRVVSDVLSMSERAEKNPPYLVQFNTWGKRIDELVTDPAWDELHRVSAEEAIVKMGYERKYKERSRVAQFAKLYLFHPSSAFYSCPLAMTDGAAKLIELYAPKELKKSFEHLTSSDPHSFWTSGQWMTERAGGSDVSHTETIARKENGEWRLYGVKWFTSAISSQMCMALARIENEKGEVHAGSRGLSLFYIELKNDKNELNGIEVLRLKEKLGTKALPTAELRLIGAKATLVGSEGEGVKLIASMFNVTRLYNSVTSLAAFRRLLTLAHDYSNKRVAFGKSISDQPLTKRILNEADNVFSHLFFFTFFVAELFGNEEVYEHKNSLGLSKEEMGKCLRLLTPVLKLYTAKKTVIWTSELLEVFGGTGYIEDSNIPRMYRDNQVFPIWEGTTNVLSLDLLRALHKDESWGILAKLVNLELDKMKTKNIEEAQTLIVQFKELEAWYLKISLLSKEEFEFYARDLAFRIGDFIGKLASLRISALKPN